MQSVIVQLQVRRRAPEENRISLLRLDLDADTVIASPPVIDGAVGVCGTWGMGDVLVAEEYIQEFENTLRTVAGSNS